jgi:hypothetical protein
MVLLLSACHTRGPKTPEPPKEDVEISEPPVLQPFARAGHFMLVEPLVIRVREGQDSLVVPSGFVTDFASIPRRLRGFISKLGPHLCPAIVHDYLYWEQTCTRAEADRIFLEMMGDLGVPWLTRRFMYWSVRGFGGSPWDRNTKRKQAGRPRIVPPDARSIGASETWSNYRDYLSTVNGHYSPSPRISPGFCSYIKAKKPKGEG